MPTRLLAVEHRTQTVAAGCLAACVQMVLLYLGLTISQRELNQLLGLTSIGVPYTNIARVQRLGYTAYLRTGDEDQLQQVIDHGQPAIVFLFTGDLSYWSANTSHAVVIHGYDDHNFYINDPAFATAPIIIARDLFMLAWSEMDYAYAVITRSSAPE